jgi:predicted ATP-grasp superfamily ATP-dependent carboligase
MQPLIWDRRPDGLRAPAMVCAFQGWNDAGDAASSAVAFLASALDARRFARIDSEEFYDFQANRPCIRFSEDDGPELGGAPGAGGGASTGAGTASEGGAREIEWPTVEIFEASAPRAPRDLVLVQGVEPSMRWRAFSAHMVDLAEALGVQVVVSLGALLGDVPHTRPVAMTGHASDAALLERVGIQASSYEGPTGIVGVLHTACAQAGLPSASLWAAVPHYVAAAANPKAALALLRRVEVLIGVSVDVSELESSAADYERQVGLAVRSDPDIQAFVERLEQAADSEEQTTPEDLPSGEIIASEFQRFLRQRGRETK